MEAIIFAVYKTELLIKLSPLLVATLHGYGAAWLAVRMLFRPHHPIYLFGRRLPLTPGILPKERERFIAALSTSIAEKLLNIEVIADELSKLDLESEITALAQREIASYVGNEAAMRLVAEHLSERLFQLSQSAETTRAIANGLHEIIDRETHDAGFFRRLAANYLLDHDTLHSIVGKAMEKTAEGIAESPSFLQAVGETLAQLPQKLLTGHSLVSSSAITALIETLSRKLDLRAILMKRLSGFTNEEIEQLVMETAGREIKAIVWFGAGIGLIVGVVQTLINFI